MKIAVLITFLVFLSSQAFAGEVKITAMVDKALATTGDEIIYTVTLEHPKSLTINIPEVGDKIMGFRIVEFGKNNPVESTDDANAVVEGNFYKLRADITGSYILPAVEVQYKDEKGEVKTVKSGEVFVEIESVLKKDQNEVPGDIRDIKAIYKTKPNYAMLALFLTGILTAIAGTIYLIKKRRGKPRPENIIPPHQVAFDRLKLLTQAKVDSTGDLKKFHFALSEIMRVYFEATYSFPATDRTMEEIRKDIGVVKSLEKTLRDSFITILKETDQVKFTDHVPTAEKNLELLEIGRKFVEATRPVEKIQSEEEGIV